MSVHAADGVQKRSSDSSMWFSLSYGSSALHDRLLLTVLTHDSLLNRDGNRVTVTRLSAYVSLPRSWLSSSDAVERFALVSMSPRSCIKSEAYFCCQHVVRHKILPRLPITMSGVTVFFRASLTPKSTFAVHGWCDPLSLTQDYRSFTRGPDMSST